MYAALLLILQATTVRIESAMIGYFDAGSSVLPVVPGTWYQHQDHVPVPAGRNKPQVLVYVGIPVDLLDTGTR